MTLKAALQMGLRKHAAGDLTGAAQVYAAILEAKPDQPEAMHFWARYCSRAETRCVG